MRNRNTYAIMIVALVVLGVGLFATAVSHADAKRASAATGAVRMDERRERPWCPIEGGAEFDVEEPPLDCPKGMVPIPRHITEEPYILQYSGEKGSDTRVLPAFCIDKFEVTVGDYRKCVRAGKCSIPTKTANYWAPRRERNPIDLVHFKEAERYCRWHGNRLPSRWEWRHACGDGGTPWPEHTKLVEGGVCWDRSWEQSTCDVGTSPQDVSKYGVYDLAGNVKEWTQKAKIYGGEWYEKPSMFSAFVPRIVGYGYDVNQLRYGFRCAWSPTPEPTE